VKGEGRVERLLEKEKARGVGERIVGEMGRGDRGWEVDE
jgi:hypothetical protein